MTRPQRYLIRMLVFVAVVLGLTGFLAEGLLRAFMVNPFLNGMILLVLLIGIGHCLRAVLKLNPEVNWLEAYRRGGLHLSTQDTPHLLGPMAAMLGERQGRISLSAQGLRSLLDSLGTRLDESREISRYLIGLLIFLGLLGTFWGLLQTVNTVGNVIAGLSLGDGDLATAFDALKTGLGGPLSGMGTAFGTSLFGLAGALVLGFLDLQSGQAQNRFYNELEEWLSSVTRIGSAGPIADGEQSVPAYLQALIEQTADSLENLQRLMARGEDNRRNVGQGLLALTEKLSVLSDQMKAEQSLLLKLAEDQSDLKPVLAKLADVRLAGLGADDATRGHIRNIEVYLGRMLEELSSGRAQSTEELRSEIRLLARTIANLADESQRAN
ncbi:MAG: flagellar motor protein MotA [Alphaproteobacteria bacterium]|nr:flagellar motor protein MotA [Alphaproteobacteria bacterium]